MPANFFHCIPVSITMGLRRLRNVSGSKFKGAKAEDLATYPLTKRIMVISEHSNNIFEYIISANSAIGIKNKLNHYTPHMASQ